MGALFREGFGGRSSVENLHAMLLAAGKDRTEVGKGRSPRLDHIGPNTPEEVTPDTPTLYREGTDYYRTPRAQRPNSQNWFVFSAVDKIAAYSSYDRVDLISPRPLLMIAGTRADTRYFSEQATRRRRSQRSCSRSRARRTSTYDKEDYVGPAVEKANGFFKKWLA